MLRSEGRARASAIAAREDERTLFMGNSFTCLKSFSSFIINFDISLLSLDSSSSSSYPRLIATILIIYFTLVDVAGATSYAVPYIAGYKYQIITVSQSI